MKKKGIVAVVVIAAVIGAAFTVSSCKLIKTGQTGIVYTYRDGVQKETLSPGLNFVGPMKKVKEFSTSNEILVMSKDKREGSKGNDSFKVATSDDASENIFQVLEESMTIHMKNVNDMVLLMRYEKGIQPLVRKKIIRKEVNIKVSDNLANQITEFKLGYVWGQPITYVQRGNKDLKKYGLPVGEIR